MPDRGPDIDLHPYIRDPVKARAILDSAIADCLSKNIAQFRVVHGKGKGHFRNLIHSHLEKHPDVEGFVLCDPSHGGSGSSWVHLKGGNFPSISAKTETRHRQKPVWRWIAYLVAIGLAFYISDNMMPGLITFVVVLWIEFRLS